MNPRESHPSRLPRQRFSGLLVLAAVLSLPQVAAAQWLDSGTTWTNSGSNITYTQDSIGIGISSPSLKLHIMGDYDLVRLQALSAASLYEGISFHDSAGTRKGGIRAHTSTAGQSGIENDLELWSDIGDVVVTAGNVGIGTVNPTEKLQLTDVAAGSDIRVGRKSATPHSAANVPSMLAFSISDGAEGGVFVFNERNAANTYNNQYLTFATHEGGISAGERMRIVPNGNVGIEQRRLWRSCTLLMGT